MFGKRFTQEEVLALMHSVGAVPAVAKEVAQRRLDVMRAHTVEITLEADELEAQAADLRDEVRVEEQSMKVLASALSKLEV